MSAEAPGGRGGGEGRRGSPRSSPSWQFTFEFADGRAWVRKDVEWARGGLAQHYMRKSERGRETRRSKHERHTRIGTDKLEINVHLELKKVVPYFAQ